MAEVFKRYKVECEFITKPYWGHGFDDALKEDSAVKGAFDQVLKFLGKHVDE